MNGHVLQHVTEEDLGAACDLVLGPPAGSRLAVLQAALLVLRAARHESSIAAVLAHRQFVQAVAAAEVLARAEQAAVTEAA